MHGLRNEVTFSAFGKYYHIPMLQFCEYTGLYTEDELHSDEFRHLPSTWAQQTDMANIWRSISTFVPYDSTKSRGTHLRDKSARILYWLLVHSLFGRVYSTNVVSQPELFAMYSMISGIIINVSVHLAFAIRHQSQVANHGLFYGAYITRILKNMNIFLDPRTW